MLSAKESPGGSLTQIMRDWHARIFYSLIPHGMQVLFYSLIPHTFRQTRRDQRFIGEKGGISVQTSRVCF